MKFFEKKPVQAEKKSASPQKKENTKKTTGGKKPAPFPICGHFFSLGSLRTVLKERSRHAKKVEHIDKLLIKRSVKR